MEGVVGVAQDSGPRCPSIFHEAIFQTDVLFFSEEDFSCRWSASLLPVASSLEQPCGVCGGGGGGGGGGERPFSCLVCSVYSGFISLDG